MFYIKQGGTFQSRNCANVYRPASKWILSFLKKCQSRKSVWDEKFFSSSIIRRWLLIIPYFEDWLNFTWNLVNKCILAQHIHKACLPQLQSFSPLICKSFYLGLWTWTLTIFLGNNCSFGQVKSVFSYCS